MISVFKVVFMGISAMICFGVPILWYKSIKKEVNMVGVWIGGALSFYLTQIVIRLPILQLWLPKVAWYEALVNNIVVYGMFLALTAALFETAGRSLTLNLLFKKRLSYKTGLVHGLGHGGIEAIMLVGLNYVIYMVYSILLNWGIEQPLLFVVPMAQQELLKNILIDTQGYLFLIAGIERGLTIVFHVAMSLLITIGIVKKQQIRTTLLVIFLHTSLDFIVVLMSRYVQSVWLIEGFILVVAILCGVAIWQLRKAIPSNPAQDEGEEAVSEGF